MTFRWADYLSLAEALLTHRATFAQEEACCRASISRAYYAVFCAARNFARDRENLTLRRTGADHQIVQRHFQNRQTREHQQLHVLLNRLRQRRNDADYVDSLPNVEALAQDAIRYARQALRTLETLRNNAS
jgi:uncharacterized protein (UPF0332 family)